MHEAPYSSWVARTERTSDELSLMEGRLAGLRNPPRISVLLAVSDSDEIWIKKSASSVLGGIYPHVELCVCDNGSERPHVAEALGDLAASDRRVKLGRLPAPADFARVHNEALSLATGRFVTVLGEGDELAPDALFGVAELLATVEADVVYADEDAVDISDRRSDPVFKPHWSSDLLLSTNYLGRPCVVRRSIVEELGGFREGLKGAEEHDLLLRIAEKAEGVRHLPDVLYHRRIYDREPVYERHEDRQGLRRAAGGALRRGGAEAHLEGGAAPGSVRVLRTLSGRPKVSVVALFTRESLADRIDDVERQTSYPLHEVIPAIGWAGEASDGLSATSAAGAVNSAAGKATGEYLLFVRNYAGTSSPDLVPGLLKQAQRDEVGAVGGRVLDGAGRILSAGSFLDLSRLTGTLPHTLALEGPSQFLPVVDHPFNPLAVSLGCMMIRRSTFENLEGFDEEKLPTDFYDLDLSFRLREGGFWNVYVPEASLISVRTHHPLPDAEEIEYMWQRWWSLLVGILRYSNSPLRAATGDLGRDLPSLLSV